MSFLDTTASVAVTTAALVAVIGGVGAGVARAIRTARENGRKADETNRMLFGDPHDQENWPGLPAFMKEMGKVTRATAFEVKHNTGRMDKLDAGQAEMLDRVARVEKKITLNGGASDDLGDIAKRVEEEVRRIGRMVATGDGMTLGQIASNDETRRIAHMEPKDRTVRENEHFDTAPDREKP